LIAHDRMADKGEVDSQLMHSSGFWKSRDQSVAVQIFKNLVFGYGGPRFFDAQSFPRLRANDLFCFEAPNRFGDDAASFFFKKGTSWSSLTEVRLNDANGKSAGNIDVVLVAYDKKGKVFDFGALEIQAVYISGNVRDPFEHYMKNPKANAQMDWRDQPNFPRPDYLSSSRKRLAPQLLFKGGILHSWQKKTVVALNKSFFETLPPLKKVSQSKAEIAWFIYDLKLGKEGGAGQI